MPLLVVLQVKIKDMPSIYVLGYTCLFLLLGASGSVKLAEVVFVLYGSYFSWVYLRFFQPKEGGVCCQLGWRHLPSAAAPFAAR